MNQAVNQIQTATDALELIHSLPLEQLTSRAVALRDEGFGRHISFSPKVFIPLTRLCRDVCHYCTFAQTPKRLEAPYLEIHEVVKIARDGELAGCREALFTLGEKPELRYRVARDWLRERGYTTTVEYLIDAAGAVLRETQLIPHINAGTLTRTELRALRTVSASMGIMIESSAQALCEPGGAHYGSPDKKPWRRLATLARAGRLNIPMTTGLLVGIGETREDRLRDLLYLRRLHTRYGNIQEVIIQNFRAKPGTLMAEAEEPSREDLCWTLAAARLILGPSVSIQAPPNLSPGELVPLINAGINDWGGISPVTPDHVNPEAPWPDLESLRSQTAMAGKRLVARLTIYPSYLRDASRWLAPSMRRQCLFASDAHGLVREGQWQAGVSNTGKLPAADRLPLDGATMAAINHCLTGRAPSRKQTSTLLAARGRDFHAVLAAADELRKAHVGEEVTFVVNRNINYTNVCSYSCAFCAFSKHVRRTPDHESAYDIDGRELRRRAIEAWEHGASEVCLQGGIHPDYDGNTYLDILRNLRLALPDLHMHAFSPLEVQHGAQTLGLSLKDYLEALRDAGLNSLPGTAAEILVDEVRDVICPDKLRSHEWLEVMATAHSVGLRSTATMMFGHTDRVEHWAEHMLLIRDLQEETGGFTEFVPLPFVAREAPMSNRGVCRNGPTLREAVLVHSVARLALGAVLPNIQVSWVKMGPQLALDTLSAGANDLGGTLFNESITRAAGAAHGQCWSAREMHDSIESRGRPVRIRRTDYRDADLEMTERALASDGIMATPVMLKAGARASAKTSSKN